MLKRISVQKKYCRKLMWLFMLTYSLAVGQQEATFSQYMFNQQIVNPAYVGAQNFTQITLLNHSQWAALEGAPQTQALSFGTKLSESIGFGISAVNDKIGLTQTTVTGLDFGYHLTLNENNLRLGLGLKVSGRLNTLDFSMLQTVEVNDRSFAFESQNEVNFNFGTGFYLYHPKFYFGMGIPYLLEETSFNLKRNYYSIFGGLFNINESIQLRPSLFFQKTPGMDWIYDNSIWLVINDRYWIGPQYRAVLNQIIPTKNGGGYYGAIAGLHFGENISIGYAYQGKIGNQGIGITNTTHEILLRFQLVSKFKGALRSPRLF